jgi:C-terminal processing protease CtpA/Prc
MVNVARNGMPSENPQQTFLGPMVTLMNEFSSSDGDIFPFRFKSLGLGKLIGKRSWGGVVGIRGTLPFVDGGSLRSRSSRLTRRTASNGSWKATALIPTSSSTTIR